MVFASSIGRPLRGIQDPRRSSGGIFHFGRHQHHCSQLADGRRCPLLPSVHPGLLGRSLPPQGDNGLNPERKPGRGWVRRQERRLPAEMRQQLAADSPAFTIRATISSSWTERPDFIYWNQRRAFEMTIPSTSRKCAQLSALRNTGTAPASPSVTISKASQNSTVASDSSWTVPQRSSGRQVTHGTLSLRNVSRYPMRTLCRRPIGRFFGSLDPVQLIIINWAFMARTSAWLVTSRARHWPRLLRPLSVNASTIPGPAFRRTLSLAPSPAARAWIMAI